MAHQRIQTQAAPKAVGAYSQGMRAGRTVYLSGQIPLDPSTGKLVEGDFTAQLTQVFENLRAVVSEAGGSLDHIVKLTVYLTDLGHYRQLHEVMETFFSPPFPARAAIGVASLPLGVPVEVDGIAVLEGEEYQY
jgi:reactive intermediate/imine deaminase